MLKMLKNFKRNEKGQAMVEMALILPLFLLIVCGILDFGWIFANQLMLNNCSREGARYAIVRSEESDMVSQVVTRVQNVSSYGNASDISISVTKTCDDVNVTVNKDLVVLTPLAGIFTSGQVVSLSSSTTMNLD